MVVVSTDFDAFAMRAALLAAVADPVRLQLLEQLAESGTRCVCNLQVNTPIAGNLLSYHLKVLRAAGLVTARKRGRWVDYTMAEDAHERLQQALPRTSSDPVATESEPRPHSYAS